MADPSWGWFAWEHIKERAEKSEEYAEQLHVQLADAYLTYMQSTS